MVSKDEVRELLNSTESYRVERTISTGDMDKFQEAICAFANDLPNSRKNGYLIIGAKDNGQISGLKVTDELLKKIAGIRSDGNILPLPVMSVEKFVFDEGDLLVVEVSPSLIPPVRYRGRTFIRIGPRRDIATEAEERILFERRTSFMATFDATPCFHATINDLNIELFKTKYLPKAISRDILSSDKRTIEEQMAALGMYDLENSCPTFAAIMLFGKNPRRFMPGAYVQFVRFKGTTKSSDIEDEKQFEDNYCELLPKLESLLEMSIIRKFPVQVSLLREEMVINYPYWALRELLMNACMHRDLQSNTPLRIYEYSDRLEILNAGGLYGNARPENFPTINDYRNPIIAGAMKTLGYVNMYNRGIGQVQDELLNNGNPSAIFNVNLVTAFSVEVQKSERLDENQYDLNAEKATSQDEIGHKSDKKGTSQDEKVHKFDKKCTSQDEEVHKSDKKGTSQDEKGHKSDKKGTSQDEKVHKSIDVKLVEFCAIPRSIAEIADFIGVKNLRNVRERYVNPQLGKTLKRTIPDKPQSSKQKYVDINVDISSVK